MSKDNSLHIAIFCQGGIEKCQRFWREDHPCILSTRIWHIGIRLIEHDANDITYHPRVAQRLSPGSAKLRGSMDSITSTFGVILVIANARIERNIAQLRLEVQFCQLVILRCSCVYNISWRNAKSRIALFQPELPQILKHGGHTPRVYGMPLVSRSIVKIPESPEVKQFLAAKVIPCK